MKDDVLEGSSSESPPAITDDEGERGLTSLELRNLIFSLLAWACTFSNVTVGEFSIDYLFRYPP